MDRKSWKITLKKEDTSASQPQNVASCWSGAPAGVTIAPVQKPGPLLASKPVRMGFKQDIQQPSLPEPRYEGGGELFAAVRDATYSCGGCELHKSAWSR